VALPLAHLGHWYVQIAFAVPSLLIIGYMGRDSLRRRRRARNEESAASTRGADPAARRGRKASKNAR
jgi:hypothetical protein